MLVVTLTNCPLSLRGDLTKWLLEINSGVFVGQVNARVRELLWSEIEEKCKNGSAVMVYSAAGEQKLDFKVLGSTWEPIDFDGIKLMLRPSPSRLREKSGRLAAGFSSAAKRRKVKSITAARMRLPASYVVIDLETTGLRSDRDEIIEMGALKIVEHAEVGSFNVLVRPTRPLPAEIEKMTGISEQMLLESGETLQDALPRFAEFIGNLPVVLHNSDFDSNFLRNAYAKCALPLFSNRCIDTLQLAKLVVIGVKDFKLYTLAAHFEIGFENKHRAWADCQTTYRLYKKLITLL
jgi:CRISPR-associated protein Cas2